MRLTTAFGDIIRPLRFAPDQWPGTWTTRHGEDGVHAILDGPAGTHRLWFPDGTPSIGAPLETHIELDRFFAERNRASLAFWQTVRPGARMRQLKPTALELHVALRRQRALRALDGRLAGASYRVIAIALFGEAEAPRGAAWKTCSARDSVIRLVAYGKRLMRGQYRALLRWPKRRR
ncbi:MAG TPA: DUF2285 domain-containing protein [Alphaproteobacteria bacterium]|nr:DUF2285 domain-containing protein [Alphaproteobacteria bacterium]